MPNPFTDADSNTNRTANPYRIFVYPLPQLHDPAVLTGEDGEVAVVIDVLRATTTMITALNSGAAEVIPLREIDDALRLKAGRLENGAEPGSILLGGERGGTLIEGFDLGNSPEDYTEERVRGKTLIFTTTNGTQAVHRASGAARLYIAAFVNAAAVVERLLEQRVIHIVCAGTDGKFTEEDLLLAGCLVERLHRLSDGRYAMNAQAQTLLDQWRHAFSLPRILGTESIPTESLAQILRRSRGGRNLMQLGLGRDILAASRIDTVALVPKLEFDGDLPLFRS